MSTPKHAFILVMAMSLACRGATAEAKEGENPADHLPPHITRATWFGERADWSNDGKRILFLSKTFGDDGNFIAFQMAKSREAAGVGHGIFIYDIGKAKEARP